MSKGYPIIGIGIISFIFGLIFDLQGQSIVGPESSFMYANPDWITYGIHNDWRNHNYWNWQCIENFKKISVKILRQ